MPRRWLGSLITIGILAGVAFILIVNLDLKPTRRAGREAGTASRAESAPASGAGKPAVAVPANFREYPIGEAVERNSLRIAAVWLPAVQVEGLAGPTGSEVVHLEADIHATEANPNGFAVDEFVPYLVITYTIVPSGGGAAVSGPLTPMVAKDGLHYGANVVLPAPGRYRLTYHIEPPSAGGLGRHHDPLTGVAPWWSPFNVSFDWDYAPAGRP